MTKQDLYSMYASDPEFVSTYHGNEGWTVDQCVEDSWDGLKNLELNMYDYGYIAVNRDDLAIRLAGFFIKPEYRNEAIKERFFEDLYNLMPRIFMCFMHSSNYKAIKFLTSKGQITKQDNITTYIVFRQENQ
jgi:hypothetical protein